MNSIWPKKKNAYFVFMCQSEAFLDLFLITQIIEFLPINITLLNKRL